MVKLPSRSVLYFSISGMIILVLVVFMIYPNYRSLKSLDNKIKQMNVQIKSQEILYPLFQRMLKEIQFKEPSGLPFPKVEKLTQAQTAVVSSVFRELADKLGLTVMGVSPDIDSSLDGSGYLLMNVTMNGEFLKIRDLLRQLGKIPYLEHIEQIKLKSVAGSKEISFKIWLLKEANEHNMNKP